MATKVASPPRRARKVAREPLPDTSDPVEIAMFAAASGRPLPEVARRVLEEQADLIHAQCNELRLRQVGERVRAALWSTLALLAFGLLILIAAVVVRALRTDALVVESFRVPPAMQAQGLTGEVVATEVLDKLAQMQSTSESARAASSYANNWGDDLKIDIPNTGATAEQVWRLLRGWLGKETRISGEVINTKAGLALTVRVGSAPGERFVSATRDLDALVASGAEVIFRNTQPYRHAVYIGQIPERSGERYTLLQRLTHDPSPMEQKWAYNGLAYDLRLKGDFRGALVMARRALAIDPRMLPALGNLAYAHGLLGHDQQAVDFNLLERRTKIGSGYDPRIIAANRCTQLGDIGAVTRNPPQVEQAADCLESAPGSYSEYAPSTHLEANWLRHEASPLLAFRQQASPGLPEAEAAAIQSLQRLRGEMLLGPSPDLARALGDYAAATGAMASSGQSAPYFRAGAPVLNWPIEAEAYSLLGKHAEAKALIDRTPLDCYACVHTRGLIAQRMGDPGGAQRWFQEAARQGPRLPAAFLDWGRLLLDNRRYGSAEVKLRRAAELAPNWADPLKYWGDLIAAQGRRDDALAKYDAALKLAPNWAELRAARERLARSGARP